MHEDGNIFACMEEGKARGEIKERERERIDEEMRARDLQREKECRRIESGGNFENPFGRHRRTL